MAVLTVRLLQLFIVSKHYIDLLLRNVPLHPIFLYTWVLKCRWGKMSILYAVCAGDAL